MSLICRCISWPASISSRSSRKARRRSNSVSISSFNWVWSWSLRASNRRVDSSSRRDRMDSSSRVNRSFISSRSAPSSRSSTSLSRRSSSFSISERSSDSISARAPSVCIPAVFARALFIPEIRSDCSCNRSRRSLFSEVRILRSSSSR